MREAVAFIYTHCTCAVSAFIAGISFFSSKLNAHTGFDGHNLPDEEVLTQQIIRRLEQIIHHQLAIFEYVFLGQQTNNMKTWRCTNIDITRTICVVCVCVCFRVRARACYIFFSKYLNTLIRDHTAHYLHGNTWHSATTRLQHIRALCSLRTQLLHT